MKIVLSVSDESGNVYGLGPVDFGDPHASGDRYYELVDSEGQTVFVKITVE